MLYYCDTSALVKRYVLEAGSDSLAKKLAGKTDVAISLLGLPELIATMHRLHREGQLSEAKLKATLRAIDEDWPSFLHVPLQPEISEFYPDIFKQSPLRGADAVHLASAMYLRVIDEDILFICADAQLLRAAERMGFQVYDPVSET